MKIWIIDALPHRHIPYKSFIINLLKEWAYSQSLSFIIDCKKEWNEGMLFSEKKFTSLIHRWFWIKVQLPLLQKIYKADAIIFLGNEYLPMLSCDCWQCCFEVSLSKKWQNAITYISPSPIDAAKNNCIIVPFKQECIPLDYQQKEDIKNQYTQGNEFIVATVDTEQDFIMLLKAFSIFKKWQKSSMKLVVCMYQFKKNERLKKSFQSYKYNKDVVVLSQEKDWSAVLGAAYMFINLQKYTDATLLCQAIQQHIVIATLGSALENYFLQKNYFPIAEKSIHSIAQTIMLAFKDETQLLTIQTTLAKTPLQFAEQRSAEVFNKAFGGI